MENIDVDAILASLPEDDPGVDPWGGANLIGCANCLDSGRDDRCWCGRCHICQDVLDDVCDYPEGV